VKGSNSQSLGDAFANCYGLLADGLGEQDGHADDGDLPQSAYATPRGGGGHDETVLPQLYSRHTARQGQDTRMLHNNRHSSHHSTLTHVAAVNSDHQTPSRAYRLITRSRWTTAVEQSTY